MEWDRYHKRFLGRYITGFLQFASRPARYIELSGDHASTNDGFNINTGVLKSVREMDEWLGGLKQIPGSSAQVQWSLKILLLRRGEATENEVAGEGSGDQLWHLGCTVDQYHEILSLFDASDLFTHCLLSERSYYSRRLNKSTQEGVTTFTLRSSASTLKDLAFCSTTHANSCSTFVLIQGCDKEQEISFVKWIRAMKDVGGHPALMAALFFEMHHRILWNRYEELNNAHILLSFELFRTDDLIKASKDNKMYRAKVGEASKLNERANTLYSEFVGYRPRLYDLIAAIDAIADHGTDSRNAYLKKHGNALKLRLQHLERESEYLQATTALLKDTSALSISSVSISVFTPRYVAIRMTENRCGTP